MSKELTAPQIAEVQGSEVKTRILVTIEHPDETIRILENDSLALFTLSGNIYYAGQVKRGEINTDMEGAVEKCPISISNINQAYSQIIAANGDTLTNTKCTVEEIIFNGFPADWQALTAYTTGTDPAVNFVSPIVKNSYIYECTTAGTTGETEPTWPTSINASVVDGTATWTCRSPIIGSPIDLFSGLMNNIALTAAGFSFDVERQIGGYSTQSPNLTYDVFCQYTFKDERCAYAGNDTTCTKTYTACNNHTPSNADRFGGFPSIVKQMVIKT